MKRWRFDLATGALATSTDGVNWTTFDNVITVRIGTEWNAETETMVVALFVKVFDAASTATVMGLSNAFGPLQSLAGYIPTREFKSEKADEIRLAVNGTDRYIWTEPTNWPTGGPEWAGRFADSGFKEPV